MGLLELSRKKSCLIRHYKLKMKIQDIKNLSLDAYTFFIFQTEGRFRT